tara:strand:- start:167 stop:433 length:267 start_codon:yes stop_codon:yes gene_type:complete
MGNIAVTKHAMKRAHERFSLPRRSVRRQAFNALARGCDTDSLSYDNSFILTKSKTVGQETLIQKYDNGYYVFELSDNVFTLITVLKIK